MNRKEELRRLATYEPTPLERATWDAWIGDLPEAVRLVAEKLKPWRPYVFKPTGALVVIYCVDQPDDATQPITLQVDVTSALNEGVLFDRRVFGVKLEDVEEWAGPEGDAS